MDKRAYSKPKIMRVRLNPEQAVLSQCSVNATSLRDADAGGFCQGGRGGGCRQATRGGRGSDSESSS